MSDGYTQADDTVSVYTTDTCPACGREWFGMHLCVGGDKRSAQVQRDLLQDYQVLAVCDHGKRDECASAAWPACVDYTCASRRNLIAAFDFILGGAL